MGSDSKAIYNFANFDEPGRNYYKHCSVRVSHNQGASWRGTGLKISTGKEKNSCNISTSAVLGDGHLLMGIFFGGGESFVYESKDGGKTWLYKQFEKDMQLRALIAGPDNTTLVALRNKERTKISFKLLMRD